MKGFSEEFMLFIAGLFIIIIVLATIFGKGIAYNFLGFLSEVEPYNLQENIRTILTVASYSPGDFEAKVAMNLKHTIELKDTPYPTVWVKPDPSNKIAETSAQPFLTRCDIVKTCVREYKLIGDKCSKQEDCYGSLSCDPTGICESTYGTCGNGVLDAGEECDPGKGTLPKIDTDCPGKCAADCSCPIDHGEDDECDSSSDCYRLLSCMSQVKFVSVGGTLLIRKYFEDDRCKIMISELK